MLEWGVITHGGGWGKNWFGEMQPMSLHLTCLKILYMVLFLPVNLSISLFYFSYMFWLIDVVWTVVFILSRVYFL